MATVNSQANSVSSKNTGLAKIAFNPKLIKAMMITPKNYQITAAQAVTLQTKLVADSCNNTKTSRIYPVANFVDFKDSSEKQVSQKFGYGPSVTVRDGAYTWQFQYTKGGHSLLQALRIFNGSNWDFFFIDQDGSLIGTSFIDGTGAKGFQSIPSIEIYTEPFMVNDGKKVADYLINCSFFPSYVNENIGFITDAGFSVPDTILGLKDVILSAGVSGTSGTYRVFVKDAQGVNLYGDLSATLNVVGQWLVTNTVSGLPIAFTAVNANAAAQSFDLVVTVADANYPGVGQSLNINLALPQVLQPVIGLYESTGPVSIVKN